MPHFILAQALATTVPHHESVNLIKCVRYYIYGKLYNTCLLPAYISYQNVLRIHPCFHMLQNFSF